MDENILEVRHLHTDFVTDEKTVQAVNDVSFEIKRGETFGLIGESGCGKSVTCRSLMRLLKEPGQITGGEILYKGKNVLDFNKKELQAFRGREIGMIFQDPMTTLNPVLTMETQLVESMKDEHMTKKQKKEYAEELFRLVGIPSPKERLKCYAHQFSGGMRQRVMIAMALACEPKLLIADEPTTALDVTIQAQILELMMELKGRLGMAIIMITHDLGVVASMCERIAVMYAGKIVEYGTTEDIFYHPKHEYTKGLIRSIPRIDTKEHERLVPIEGSPVDLLNPPKGCPFAPRCEKCMKICLREMPPVTSFGEVHYTQCWLNQKEETEKGAANE